MKSITITQVAALTLAAASAFASTYVDASQNETAHTILIGVATFIAGLVLPQLQTIRLPRKK